ncbi:hypothetical protein [Streptacidiphilus fuscans]|uniref:Uncharacterized protein n=1 Tax=Streptacidiphilus fuscans TaxID=2789292 RepID=A0A931B4Y3_9ACTN|nr:hypothetical protein [Streptacidiphilus fuscans]MBF9069472.1 hypothetical protein [Streptacidiphilus fuscans]
MARRPGGRRRLRLKLWQEALALAVVVAAVLWGIHASGWLNGNVTQTQDPSAVAAALTAVRTGRCPAEPPKDQATDVYGTGDVLEPLTANRLLLCGYAYWASNGTRTVQRTSRVITDQATINGFRSALNALPTPPGGTYECPNDTGSAALEIFTDGGHEVELLQAVTGCQSVTNGVREGWVGTSQVGGELIRLLPPSFCTDAWRDSCSWLSQGSRTPQP